MSYQPPSPGRSSRALVLGGGIMGLSFAWALRRAGWQVTLIEQDALPNPRGASVDDHRLIRHAYGAQRGYMRMVDDAYAAWKLLFGEIGTAPLHETGVLALGPGGPGWLADSRAALAAENRAFENLTPEETARRYPMLELGGTRDILHTPAGGVLLARPIVAALAAHLGRIGVTIERARARDVDPERARLLLEDDSERSADLLVLAAGPWAPRLLPGLSGRVTASRQVVVYLEPPPMLRASWDKAPMLLDIDPTGGFYAVPPVAGTPLKVGDHRFSCRGDAEDPREASAAEAEEILAFVRPKLRDAAAYRLLGARACYYDVEPGERFLVEKAGPATWIMSGFSGHGFKFGALLGLALAAAAEDAALAAALPAWAAGEAPPPPALLGALRAAA
ncbi:FAD-dependent oxidoreductase [Acetobacteraceae bacterium H6797]|nr:FAD-dependent oxidoreductase [Acetobacteraceae bacterium H6797]